MPERLTALDASFLYLEKPHLHMHVVPRRKGDGLFGKTFQWMRHPYPNEGAIRSAQAAIRAALA